MTPPWADDDWRRLEAPLLRLDPALHSFAVRHGMRLTRNTRESPERSLVREFRVRRLIQVYVEDPASPTYTVWVCASQDRQGSRYWRNEFVLRGVTAEELERDPAAWLDDAYRRVTGWRARELEFATRLGGGAPAGDKTRRER